MFGCKFSLQGRHDEHRVSWRAHKYSWVAGRSAETAVSATHAIIICVDEDYKYAESSLHVMYIWTLKRPIWGWWLTFSENSLLYEFLSDCFLYAGLTMVTWPCHLMSTLPIVAWWCHLMSINPMAICPDHRMTSIRVTATCPASPTA